MFAREVSDAEIAAALANWRTEGWALLPGIASVHTLAGLRERLEDLIAGRAPDPGLFFQPDSLTGRYADLVRAEGWAGPDRAYRKIERLELDDRFRAWLENPLFERVVRAVIPCGVTLYRAVLFLKAAHGGSDLPYHQDAGKMWGLDHAPELQLWTALDDAPPAAGCLEVFPRSHLRGLATPLGGVVPAAQVEDAGADAGALRVPARAGDVVLLHTHLWHRSAANTTDAPRRGFTVCYLPETTRCLRTRRAPRRFLALFQDAR